MKDINRIDELLSLVATIWEDNQNLRFNQLLWNLQREYKDGKYIKKAYVDEIGWGTVDVTYPDLFSVEDDDFIEFLKLKVKNI